MGLGRTMGRVMGIPMGRHMGIRMGCSRRVVFLSSSRERGTLGKTLQTCQEEPSNPEPTPHRKAPKPGFWINYGRFGLRDGDPIRDQFHVFV